MSLTSEDRTQQVKRRNVSVSAYPALYFMAVAVCWLNIGCVNRDIDVSDNGELTAPEQQTILLQQAAAIAKTGNREEAVRIGEKVNSMSRYSIVNALVAMEHGLASVTRRFRYDVPSSWRYISDGRYYVFTMATCAASRQRAAKLGAAAMGLLVELGMDRQYDFAADLGDFDPVVIQSVAREQASRGHAAEAAGWALRLPTQKGRDSARLGIAEAVRQRGQE